MSIIVDLLSRTEAGAPITSTQFDTIIADIEAAFASASADGHVHGTTGLSDEAVTYAKMQHVGAASKLLGRGDSGVGDVEEITLGAGLSMTGSTLAASGAGLPADDTTAVVQGSADNTKRLRFEVDGFTTGTTRVVTPADRDWAPTVFGEELAEVADAGAGRTKLGFSDLAQWNISGRIVAGSGVPVGLGVADLTEEATPAAGDFLIGWDSAGALRKFDIGDLPGTVDVSGTPTITQYARWVDDNTLEGRSTAQVLADIGAAAAVHTHNVIDLTPPTQIDALDDNFTYSLVTHGEPFIVYADIQTGTNDWTFDLAQGTAGKARGVLINYSVTESVNVRMEDVDSPPSYLTDTLPPRHMAFIFKRADSQWLLGGIAPVALGGLAIQDSVQVGDISSLAQWRLVGRISAGTGVGEAVDPSALVEEGSPASGDWLLLQKTTGEFRKVQNVNVGSAAVAPAANTLDTTLHELLNAEREHLNVVNVAAAATNIVVPDVGSAGSKWHGWALTGSAVSVSVARGSINGTSASSTNVTDAVWGTPSGNNVTITSAGNGLPVLVAGDHFSIRNHSNAANNGIYVATGSPTAGSLPSTKLSGSAPQAAASEAVDVDEHAKVTLAGNGSEWRATITAQPGTAAEVQLEGETAEARSLAGNLDGNNNEVFGYRVTHVPVTGARGVADADSGKTLIYSGAGHTWTFNDADLTAGAHGVIRNAGSGAITVTTDGVEKFIGTEPIAVGKSATWEWDGTNLWLDVNA